MENQGNNSTDSTVTEQDTNLSLALSSLLNQNDSLEVLKNIKIIVGYLSTYNLAELEEKLLQYVLPVLQSNMQKTFSENILLSDTCDDDFVLNTLKQNLEVITHFLHIVKDILEFLAGHSEICLVYIQNVVLISIQILSSSFEHCKESSETYKKNLSEHLIDIFKLIQDIHILYIQLFESNIIITLEEESSIRVLLEVLENLCIMSKSLKVLNGTLLVVNWKGYLQISQKFVEVLKNHVDLKLPITCLSSIICEKLSSLTDPDFDGNQTSEVIRLPTFLIKVVLKLVHIFWQLKQKNLDEIIKFCCKIYSYSIPSFLMVPVEVTNLINDMIFTNTKSLVLKLQQDDFFPEVVNNELFLSDEYCFGFLNFLNVCLEVNVLSEEIRKPQLNTFIRLIFVCVSKCFEKFFLPENVFDSLVINVTAAVMTHCKFYGDIEIILLENILQEEIWNYFLASEIWCLLLRNSNPKFCSETLTRLVKIFDQLNFGVNTYRLEEIYFVSLLRRIFFILPDYLKCQMKQNMCAYPRVWKKIGFKHFPEQMKHFMEDVESKALEKLVELGEDNFIPKDLVILVENLESLCSIDYQQMCMSPTNILIAIEKIWELQFTDTTNNIFRYFIVTIYKITSNFTTEFNNKQLYTILNQLSRLSSDNYFHISTTAVLKTLCCLNSNRLGQDGRKIFTTIATILSGILLNSNNIVKLHALEVLEAFVENEKLDIVKEVFANCRDNQNVQNLISDFTRKTYRKSQFNSDYFRMVGNLKYSHSCIKWKNEFSLNKHKKLKLDNFVEINHKPDVCKTKDTPVNLSGEEKTLRCFKPQLRDYKHTKRDDLVPITEAKNTDLAVGSQKLHGKERCINYTTCTKGFKYKSRAQNEEPEENDSVDEVLCRIKGEIKCLTDVLKSEKLSAKNVSDLKIITNKLLSFM